MRKEKLEEINSIINELKAVEFIELKKEPGKNFLKTISYNVKLNNGSIIPREELIKGGNTNGAAIIIPVLENGELLTIIEPRVFCKLTVGISFPAGYIENGENPELGALRELREETGYEPETIELLDSFYQDQGCSRAMNYIYLAKGCKKVAEQKLDEFEIIKYVQLTYEELVELEKMEYIKGGSTKIALLRYKEKESEINERV